MLRRLPRASHVAAAAAAVLLVAGCTAGPSRPTPSPAARTPAPTATTLGGGAARGANARIVTSWPASFLDAPVPARAIRLHGHPVLYLTFDDGPSPLETDAMLQVLRRHHAKATFFVIGERAAAYPGLVRDEIAAGDSVGGHTWTHPHLRSLSPAAVTAQLARTRDLIRTLGAPARCYRPPFGESDAMVLGVAKALHLHQYLWTTESKDWTRASAGIDLAKVLAGLQPGAIIVFHDWVPQSLQVVDKFLTIATRQGYIAAPLPC